MMHASHNNEHLASETGWYTLLLMLLNYNSRRDHAFKRVATREPSNFSDCLRVLDEARAHVPLAPGRLGFGTE